MVTEYERLLQSLLDEKRAKLQELKMRPKPSVTEMDSVVSEIQFVEGELRRYEQGMSLFRSKGVPKVGRWGKPESGEEEAQPEK